MPNCLQEEQRTRETVEKRETRNGSRRRGRGEEEEERYRHMLRVLREENATEKWRLKKGRGEHGGVVGLGGEETGDERMKERREEEEEEMMQRE